jgi:hypothetical protein
MRNFSDGASIESLRQSDDAFRKFLSPVVLGPPTWRPRDAKAESKYSIPYLPFVSDDDLPSATTNFDKVHSVEDKKRCIVNFYVDDSKINRLMSAPQRFVFGFEGFWGTTSPDFSLATGAPFQERVEATYLNRSIGLVFVRHGIRVVPHVRWASPEDYEHCFAGVEKGSVVAVSNHGNWREQSERSTFLSGLKVLRERLQPSTVLLHGTHQNVVRDFLGPDIRVLHLPSRQECLRVGH